LSRSIFDVFEGKRFELLYQGSRDGFKMAEFHKRCDGHRHTLTIILSTKGNIFGGYTPLAWLSSGGYQRDDSLNSFLFTLKNPHGIDPTRFKLKSGSSSNTIHCDSRWLIFGNGHDLYVVDNCNASSSPSNLNGSFENTTQINGQCVLDGAYNFTVQEIEVFEILE
jgi:hypothetical protein